MATEIQGAYENSVAEGEERLKRSWPTLLATGSVGGIDVGMGVLGLLLVTQATGNEVLGSLAFGIGFLALTLAKSELFTENFLVPIAAVVARRASWLSVLRLWVGTLVTNLLAGWVITLIIIAGLPQLGPAMIKIGTHLAEQRIGVQSFASAVLGGAIITLMTWMERGTESDGAKIVAAFAAAFLLAAGHLNHAIVISLEMFGALHAGASFGYLIWARLLGWSILGNVIGGIGLVTALRLVQVGRESIKRERATGSTTGIPQS